MYKSKLIEFTHFKNSKNSDIVLPILYQYIKMPSTKKSIKQNIIVIFIT